MADTILALGTDIVSVNRLEQALNRSGFAERILTPEERKRSISAPYLAGRWAAKEAIKKCLPRLCSWQDVSIISDGGVAPVVVLKEGLLRPSERVMISISHEREFAVATCLLVQAN